METDAQRGPAGLARQAWEQRTRLVLFTAVLLITYLPLSTALPSLGLDPSWSLGLSYALEKGMRFGREVVFTYGPLGGPFVQQTWNGALLPVLALWSAIVGGTAYAAHVCLLHRSWSSSLLALLPLALLYSVDSLVLYTMFCIALGAEALATRAWACAALMALVAALTLCKFTFGVAGLIALLPLYVAIYRRWQGSPRFALLSAYPLSLVAAWLGCGQRIGDLWGYAQHSMQMAGGYQDAMGIPGPDGELATAALVLVGLFALVLEPSIRAVLRWRVTTQELATLVKGLSLAILGYLAFKQGVVRHDGHIMVFAAFVGSALITHELAQSGLAPRYRAVLGRTVLVLGVWFLVNISRQYVVGGLVESALTRSELRFEEASTSLSVGRDTAPADFKSALDRARAAYPLPPVSGRVDAASRNITSVLAHRLHWAPRPVFQSYAAYTKELAALNGRHIADAKSGPRHYFVELGPIDGRAALQEDPFLWPELLERFALVSLENPLHFERLSTARHFVRKKQKLEELSPDGFWSMPAEGGFRHVLLSAAPERSFSERLRSLLVRPRLVFLELQLTNGEARKVRFISSLKDTAFLLSPFIERNMELAVLSHNPAALVGKRVKAFRFIDEDGQPVSVAQTPEITLVSDQADSGGSQRTGDPIPLAFRAGSDDVRANPLATEHGQIVTNAHAPATYALAATGGPLKVCFGIRDGGAWEHAEFDGVLFRIRAEGTASTLLERVLSPKAAAPTGRGECVELRVPEGTREVLLETESNGTPAYDWAYWDISRGARE